MTPVLLTTVHDPHGQMLDATQQTLTALCELYQWRIVIEATENTDQRLLRILSLCTQISYSPPGDIAIARRRLLRNGLRHYPVATHYHLADFDRLLHWQLNYPGELAEVVSKLPHCDFTVLGRTSRAMGTHPFVQRETERLASAAFSLGTSLAGPWRGTKRWVDVLTASRGISNHIAQRILAHSVADGPAGVDCEWPLIASRYCEVSYIATEGLEYESATFGIGRRGLVEWRLRLKNLRDAIRIIWRYETDRLGNIRDDAKSAATRQSGT